MEWKLGQIMATMWRRAGRGNQMGGRPAEFASPLTGGFVEVGAYEAADLAIKKGMP